jgi:hypothetical protein
VRTEVLPLVPPSAVPNFGEGARPSAQHQSGDPRASREATFASVGRKTAWAKKNAERAARARSSFRQLAF